MMSSNLGYIARLCLQKQTNKKEKGTGRKFYPLDLEVWIQDNARFEVLSPEPELSCHFYPAWHSYTILPHTLKVANTKTKSPIGSTPRPVSKHILHRAPQLQNALYCLQIANSLIILHLHVWHPGYNRTSLLIKRVTALLVSKTESPLSATLKRHTLRDDF